MTMITRSARPDPAGTSIARFIIAQVRGAGSITSAIDIAEDEARSTPQVAKAVRELMYKSAIGPVAPPALTELYREFFGLLQSNSIFGRFAALARRVPFRQPVPRDLTASSGGAWRAEGQPRPVMATAGDHLTLDYTESGVIVVLTRELFRFSPTAEPLLTQTIAASVSKFIDWQLLDASISAATGRPASLTNGAVVVTSSGTAAAAILTDLESLLTAIETPGDSLVWVMRPLTYRRIVTKLASLGLYQPVGLLLGVPVLLGSTSPQQITLIDAQSIAVAHDDVASVDVTTEATLEMATAPTQDGSDGTGAEQVSLYQSGLVGIHATIPATWEPIYVHSGSPAQASGVAYMTVTY